MIYLGFLVSVVLAVLKLVGLVAFTWLTVAAPFLIGLGLEVVVFLLGLAFIAIVGGRR